MVGNERNSILTYPKSRRDAKGNRHVRSPRQSKAIQGSPDSGGRSNLVWKCARL